MLEHARRYPLLAESDVCKLLHQAALGSEHAVKDAVRVQAWLERELAEMGPGPDEPLIDPISPDGAILRVHLRPLVRLGLDPYRLNQAFIQTANTFPGSPQRFDDYAACAVQLAADGELPCTARGLQAFITQLRQAGLPAVHHSEVYTHSYRPAYRVVAAHLLPPGFLTT